MRENETGQIDEKNSSLQKLDFFKLYMNNNEISKRNMDIHYVLCYLKEIRK